VCSLHNGLFMCHSFFSNKLETQHLAVSQRSTCILCLAFWSTGRKSLLRLIKCINLACEIQDDNECVVLFCRRLKLISVDLICVVWPIPILMVTGTSTASFSSYSWLKKSDCEMEISPMCWRVECCMETWC